MGISDKYMLIRIAYGLQFAALKMLFGQHDDCIDALIEDFKDEVELAYDVEDEDNGDGPQAYPLITQEFAVAWVRSRFWGKVEGTEAWSDETAAHFNEYLDTKLDIAEMYAQQLTDFGLACADDDRIPLYV